MEIRVLRYFLSVVHEESITKAAEVLHITQPTLSRQLALLEEEVGVKLFDKGIMSETRSLPGPTFTQGKTAWQNLCPCRGITT